MSGPEIFFASEDAEAGQRQVLELNGDTDYVLLTTRGVKGNGMHAGRWHCARRDSGDL